MLKRGFNGGQRVGGGDNVAWTASSAKKNPIKIALSEKVMVTCVNMGILLSIQNRCPAIK
jgi:hypothetical protein